MIRPKFFPVCTGIVSLLCFTLAQAQVSVTVESRGKPISPDLFGIFFEDLNYAADGGLYAELIQNRSFEYEASEQVAWNSLTSWELVLRGGGKGSLAIETASPIHPNNPHYVVVNVATPGAGVGLANSGFDGIVVQAGEKYDLSLFARQLYLGPRWGGTQKFDVPSPLVVRLESADGTVLGEASVNVLGSPWQRHTATITAAQTDPKARLVLLATTQGGLGLDEISLFPHRTFRDHPNGLRADLAQVLADLKPRFVRFPGGCLVHGDGLGNMYRWKDTIGPVEQRRGQANIWRYHQSVGLGFFEFFQFCEDIGAKPLPIVPAAVCCQNSGQTSGTGQEGLRVEEMPAFIQDVLDLIEYANGPATSTWGAKRVAAGHPESFNLEYLGIGNEDAQTPVFRERFKMIYDAVRAKRPEITVIGTVGPSPSGKDFNEGWKFANKLNVPIVDEHYYEPPDWFLSNQHRYDSYDRSHSMIFIGEYASKGNAWSNALAEAVYMTSLERNGDVVRLASYAPLLAREGHTQWNPDLIYFNATCVCPTVNYQVQRQFSLNHGDVYFPTTVGASPRDASVSEKTLGASCVKDGKTGDIILKLVNLAGDAVAAQVSLPAEFSDLNSAATVTVLSGDPRAKNTFATPEAVIPRTSQLTVSHSFQYELPASSLTVIRIKGSRPIK
jgi:alpha-L-arabinofuranosidase